MCANENATVAISLLIHGEAVRFNRGKARGDDFDFKYLQGADGHKYPYVSSQCFKKYWRESLTDRPSPITREKNARGEEKNQAYTSGNPLEYEDDDLFGYMIAGAEGEEPASTNGEEPAVLGVAEVDQALEAVSFGPDEVKNARSLLTRLKDGSTLSTYLVGGLGEDQRAIIVGASDSAEPSAEAIGAMIEALNTAVKDTALFDDSRFKATAAQKKAAQSTVADEVVRLNRELLQRAFARELEQKKKRPTTRRTAPIRMHALVAFSDIRTAKDFQTFSRDVALTGKNSILNPNPVGIYSGWLKTRILIEAHRLGKFYVGENLDILDDLIQGLNKQSETDPYSRAGNQVTFVQLDIAKRKERLRHALEALANIGNRQGPASGALHDGSLKPKAFVAALMNCADSPFDSVWVSGSACPTIDVHRLDAVIRDWEDLFLTRRIYIGLPIEAAADGETDPVREAIVKRVTAAGFEPVIGTPRQTLLRLAADVSE